MELQVGGVLLEAARQQPPPREPDAPVPPAWRWPGTGTCRCSRWRPVAETALQWPVGLLHKALDRHMSHPEGEGFAGLDVAAAGFRAAADAEGHQAPLSAVSVCVDGSTSGRRSGDPLPAPAAAGHRHWLWPAALPPSPLGRCCAHRPQNRVQLHPDLAHLLGHDEAVVRCEAAELPEP